MMMSPDDNPLENLARRAAADPYFLASGLAGYQDRHDLDDAGLAAFLGCSLDVLPRLALCRMPSADDAQRAADLAGIATHFGLSLSALRTVVDEAEHR
jgi:hypothetical protein